MAASLRRLCFQRHQQARLLRRQLDRVKGVAGQRAGGRSHGHAGESDKQQHEQQKCAGARPCRLAKQPGQRLLPAGSAALSGRSAPRRAGRGQKGLALGANRPGRPRRRRLSKLRLQRRGYGQRRAQFAGAVRKGLEAVLNSAAGGNHGQAGLQRILDRRLDRLAEGHGLRQKMGARVGPRDRIRLGRRLAGLLQRGHHVQAGPQLARMMWCRCGQRVLSRQRRWLGQNAGPGQKSGARSLGSGRVHRGRGSGQRLQAGHNLQQRRQLGRFRRVRGQAGIQRRSIIHLGHADRKDAFYRGHEC